MQKVLYFIAIILLATTKVGAQDNFNDRAKKYIDQYASLAIMEQHKNGIPAAVTLGQGILETEAGISELMTEANNHFGIKCKNGWQGETYTYTDDAPDECFKKYKCAEESYRDHTDLLKRNPRYAPLFSLKQTDYAGWARCLKKCGYATNPQYAQRLIKIIEDYSLQQYTYTALDSSLMNNYKLIPASYSTPMPDTIAKQAVVRDTIKHKTNVAEHKAESPRIIISHDRHTVKDGETLATIAQMEGVEVKKIMEFNFLYPNEEPIVGSVLELQKPARQKPQVRVGAMTAHKSNAIVAGDDKTGQDGDYIDKTKAPAAQPPVVKPATVATPAPAPTPAVIPAAQPVATNNTVPVKTRPSRQALSNPAPAAAEDDPKKDQELASMKADLDKVVYADDSKLIAENAPPPTVQTKPEPQPGAAKGSKFYTVKKGDTAFSIARKNNITVSQLMKWNNMDGGTVKLGQVLQVKE